MKGRSEASGPRPRRGRSVWPGNLMSRPLAVTRQTEPSLAGAFSSAVRSATSAPGK